MSSHADSLVAHQFETADQQKEAAGLGMWAFLMTEILFFGGLFAGYIIYRMKYPAAWTEGSQLLDVALGGFNTAVLIGSSLTMALAVWAGHKGNNKLIIWFLIATILLGGVFLGVKAIEYEHKWAEQHVPGLNWEMGHLEHPQTRIFVAFYFVMTGMHATHMVIGIGLMIWLIVLASRNRFSAAYYSPVEMFGLYWHFVDIVWIFLYPLLYLLGRS